MSDSRSKGTTRWRDEPSETPLLSATDVVVDYPVKGWRAAPFRALKGVSIVIHQGETLGLVGESGSGKTTLGRAILGLAPVTEGSIHHRGRPIHQLDRRARRSLSKELQVVFQDPYSSLNPSLPIGDILTEPLLIEGASKEQARERVAELLEHVHLPKDAVSRLPREFSGGQRQRIAIARALCRQPRLIVCDEPVSALDLSTQARVLDLLIELQERLGVSFLFISHDLTVVRYIAHRTAVMLEGEIVEEGDTATVTSTPKHTYTERLLLAAPVADPERQAERRTRRQQFAAAHGGTRSS